MTQTHSTGQTGVIMDTVEIWQTPSGDYVHLNVFVEVDGNRVMNREITFDREKFLALIEAFL